MAIYTGGVGVACPSVAMPAVRNAIDYIFVITE